MNPGKVDRNYTFFKLNMSMIRFNLEYHNNERDQLTQKSEWNMCRYLRPN